MNRRSIPGLALLVLALLCLICSRSDTAFAQDPLPESTPDAATRDQQMDVEPEPAPTGLLDDVVVTRTPAPTATPGRIQTEVESFTTEVGLDKAEVLGLRAADWINLVMSALFILLAYAAGTLLIRRVLPPLVQRTPSQFDDQALKAVGSDLRWLVVLLLLQYTTKRLVFMSAEVKSLLADVYFVIALGIIMHIIFRLLDLADNWYRESLVAQGRLVELDALLTLLVRVGRVIAVIAGVSILLNHFGVNVTAFAAALGIGGLAFSLAARDTIADAIAGFIILVDRPFRIGDRIEIQEIDTWGDVVNIGLRTTRIRTRDNRMVIVPNSSIGSNQVVNYTYPDTRYRVQTHVSIAYGTDIETVRQLFIETVRHIEGVLPDKPVDALYLKMGDSAMVFRVRWWIESYIDMRRMYDQVHTALQKAIDEAGIESPFPTQTVNVNPGSPTSERPTHTGATEP